MLLDVRGLQPKAARTLTHRTAPRKRSSTCAGRLSSGFVGRPGPEPSARWTPRLRRARCATAGRARSVLPPLRVVGTKPSATHSSINASGPPRGRPGPPRKRYWPRSPHGSRSEAVTTVFALDEHEARSEHRHACRELSPHHSGFRKRGHRVPQESSRPVRAPTSSCCRAWWSRSSSTSHPRPPSTPPAPSSDGRLLVAPRLEDRYASYGVIASVEQVGRFRGGSPAAVLKAERRGRIGSGVSGPGAALWVEVEPVDDARHRPRP